jgi:hypothetical protein
MPDREKVINALERCEPYELCYDDSCPYYRDAACLEKLRQDALALLKEQEAKPVIVTTNAYGTRFYHCPRCNRDLYAYPRQSYCSNCGQAVKWE